MRPPAPPSSLRQQVVAYLQSWPQALLLFSGGLDSALLLVLGREALGRRLRALTFVGPHIPPGETAAAWQLSRRLSHPLALRPFDPLRLPDFRDNTPRRCYGCKQAMVAEARRVAASLGITALWDGTNLDDLAEDRPGLQALKEGGVLSPFLELGLGKREIRLLSRELGLPADKPPQSCLATRFAPQTPLSPEALAQVGRAEAWLRRRGFARVRLRLQGELARLELAPAEWPRFLSLGLKRPLLSRLAGFGVRGLELGLPG